MVGTLLIVGTLVSGVTGPRYPENEGLGRVGVLSGFTVGVPLVSVVVAVFVTVVVVVGAWTVAVKNGWEYSSECTAKGSVEEEKAGILEHSRGWPDQDPFAWHTRSDTPIKPALHVYLITELKYVASQTTSPFSGRAGLPQFTTISISGRCMYVNSV